jgi:hypothetical protein
MFRSAWTEASLATPIAGSGGLAAAAGLTPNCGNDYLKMFRSA